MCEMVEVCGHGCMGWSEVGDAIHHRRLFDVITGQLRQTVVAVHAGQLTPAQAIEATLERLQAQPDQLGAVVALDADRSRDEARRVDPGSPLAGVGLLVKDLDSVAGWSTSSGMGSAFASTSPNDSTMIGRLRGAGAVIVGVTNTSPFGYASITDGPAFGPARNPRDLRRTAGGSSGGSAAAVAANLAPLATGSDGGGSLRIPASACGIPGVALTRGRIPGGPQSGVWWELSTPGVLTTCVDDLACVLDVVCGPDLGDPRSLPSLAAGWASTSVRDARPMRIGVSMDLGYAPLDDGVATVVRDALKALDHAGCQLVEVPPLFTGDPVHVWWHLASPYLWEATKHLYDTEHWATLPPDLSEQAEYGRTQPVQAFFDAKVEAAAIAKRVHHEFDELGIDVMATPTCAAVPPLLGEPARVAGNIDPNWVRFTYFTNLTDQPAASIPSGVVDGVPIGMQLIARTGDDAVLLGATAFAERTLSQLVSE